MTSKWTKWPLSILLWDNLLKSVWSTWRPKDISDTSRQTWYILQHTCMLVDLHHSNKLDTAGRSPTIACNHVQLTEKLSLYNSKDHTIWCLAKLHLQEPGDESDLLDKPRSLLTDSISDGIRTRKCPKPSPFALRPRLDLSESPLKASKYKAADVFSILKSGVTTPDYDSDASDNNTPSTPSLLSLSFRMTSKFPASRFPFCDFCFLSFCMNTNPQALNFSVCDYFIVFSPHSCALQKSLICHSNSSLWPACML